MEIIDKTIVLGSKSPRRQQLLKELGFSFTVKTMDTDESFPDAMDKSSVATFLAEKKAAAFLPFLDDREVLITADTVVLARDRIFNKPENEREAREMLQALQGDTHRVITAVCIRDLNQQLLISDSTQVEFSPLDGTEIDYYINTFKPFDKAGAYGIQEWIGLVGIIGIKGSFYTVMGLPVQKVYQAIKSTYDLRY
jgi:septum formation protein